MVRRRPSVSMIIIFNDYYGNYVINVKGGKRQKCFAGYVDSQTKNVFTAKERIFPSTKEFNRFLQNILNKIRLQAFL